MNRGGDFIRNPDRRARLLVIIQGIWVVALLVLTLWWGTLLKQQSDEIARLETQLKVDEYQIQKRLNKTERMITGESSTFVLLILITNSVLLYLFVRDHRRSKSLQAFFASITHELRTPLTSIKLQAEALRDIEDNPKHAPYVNRLLEDVGRLEGQVQQTLELARLEGGGALTLQSIPLKSFIKNKVVRMIDSSSQRIQFKSNLDSLTDSTILADATALTIIFRNLIDNAIKYSRELPAEIFITSQKNNQQIHLQFYHKNALFSGDAPNLGNLFYRGKNSQGAGVGLYLVKTLMQKMHGNAAFNIQDGFAVEMSFKIDTDSEALS